MQLLMWCFSSLSSFETSVGSLNMSDWYTAGMLAQLAVFLALFQPHWVLSAHKVQPHRAEEVGKRPQSSKPNDLIVPAQMWT